MEVQRNVVVRYQSRSGSTGKELVESVGHLSLVAVGCKHGREIGTRGARVGKLILIDLDRTGFVVGEQQTTEFLRSSQAVAVAAGPGRVD